MALAVNSERTQDNQIEVVPTDELIDMAEEWIARDEQALIDSINGSLHNTPDDPVVLLPVPHVDLSHEEIVTAWDFAGPKSSPQADVHFRNERFWRDLKQWNSKALCYFNPTQQEIPVRFAAIETGFDASRIGPRLRDESNFDPEKTTFQLEEVFRLRKEYPYVRPADLFAGAVLASRFANVSTDDSLKDVSQKTKVWDILLQPDDSGCIAGDGWLPTASITEAGYGDVSFVTGMYGRYSKRMVMKK